MASLRYKGWWEIQPLADWPWVLYGESGPIRGDPRSLASVSMEEEEMNSEREPAFYPGWHFIANQAMYSPLDTYLLLLKGKKKKSQGLTHCNQFKAPGLRMMWTPLHQSRLWFPGVQQARNQQTSYLLLKPSVSWWKRSMIAWRIIFLGKKGKMQSTEKSVVHSSYQILLDQPCEYRPGQQSSLIEARFFSLGGAS